MSLHRRRFLVGNGKRRLVRNTVGQFELLEPRCLLAAPSLAPISDVTVLSGAPTYVVLDGADPDGDPLAFSVTVSNESITRDGQPAGLETLLPEGEHSLRLVVEDFGTMEFQLFESWAPRTTSRIIELVEDGFYDGLTFHRVIEDFVIQGGDPTGTGMGGSGQSFDDEFSPLLMHTQAGVLSMAKTTDDTNDSQFFITNAPARWLDFNHSVFGFLTSGDEVRQQIAAVPTDSDDRPITPVVIQSAEIFQNTQDRVLVLTAPEGAAGQADVTVTVTDGSETAEYTFHVTVVPDQIDNNAYLQAIPPVHTKANTPTVVHLPVVNLEGDDVQYYAAVVPENENIVVSVEPTTGALSVWPQNDVYGVFTLHLGVSDPDAYTSDPWDTQFVPLYIDPPPPSGVTLLPESDTGSSNSDGVTNLNNSADRTLRFQVEGVIPGAEVVLLADGVNIGKTTAQDDSAVIETDGNFLLSDGSHDITAVQVLRNLEVSVGNLETTVDLFSDDSPATTITVDTHPPVFISHPVTVGAEGRLYFYDANVVGEALGEIAYELAHAPPGMELTEPELGFLSWVPDENQAGIHDVVLQAIDQAGNVAEQAFQITVADAPRLKPIADLQVVEGQTVEFTAEAEGGQGELRFELVGDVPEGASIDPVTGHFSWTPSEAQGPGQYTVTVRVKDQQQASHSQQVNILVSEQNTPPQLGPIDDVFVNEGELLELTIGVNDPDLPPQQMTFELLGDVRQGMTIDSNGLLRWLPAEKDGPGMYSVTVRVTDPFGAATETQFKVHVLEVDRAPVFEPLPTPVVVPGDKLEVRFSAHDPDQPAKLVKYELVEGPNGVELDPETGLLTWQVPADFQLSHPSDSVRVLVRAVELSESGVPGLSTTVPLKIQVIDVRTIGQLLAAASIQTEQQLTAISPELTPPAHILPQPGSLATVDSATDKQEVPANTTASGRPLFAGNAKLDNYGVLTRPTAGMLGRAWQPIQAAAIEKTRSGSEQLAPESQPVERTTEKPQEDSRTGKRNSGDKRVGQRASKRSEADLVESSDVPANRHLASDLRPEILDTLLEQAIEFDSDSSALGGIEQPDKLPAEHSTKESQAHSSDHARQVRIARSR